jgi:hypothetical protein
MKLNTINTKKLYENGAKNPAMLAGVVLVYGIAMTLAVIKSVKDSASGGAGSEK